MNDSRQCGFTIVELVVLVGLGMIVLMAVVGFSVRLFLPSREQFEKGTNVRDARVEMERMGDVIRSAKSGFGRLWLISATPTSITVQANIDNDMNLERVTYGLNNTTLYRIVDGVRTNLSVHILNTNPRYNQPFLRYYSLASGGTALVSDRGLEVTPSADSYNAIDRVAITLVVDSNLETNTLDGVVLETVVTPRKGYYRQ